MWLAYDAVYSTTAVSGGPTGKVGAFNNGASVVYYQTAKPSYTPALLAQFTLNNASRGNLNIKGGFSSSTGTTPTSYASTHAIQNQGGAYAFDGTAYAVDGTFVLDLSSGVVTTGSANYYLAASNNSSTTPLDIKDFRLINVPRATETAASRLPASFSGGTQYVSINYDFANGASAPVAVISATSSGDLYNFNGASSYDPNSGTSITNYEWNFGDGSAMMSGSNVSHLFTKQGTFNVTLKVTSSLGLSSTSSHSVNIADTVAPSAPVLSASLATTTAKGKRRTPTTSVKLSWSGASDNVGVAKYQIYRNGSLLTTTTSISFSDTNTVAGGVYNYYVIAVDAAGNFSANSNTATVQR